MSPPSKRGPAATRAQGAYCVAKIAFAVKGAYQSGRTPGVSFRPGVRVEFAEKLRFKLQKMTCIVPFLRRVEYSQVAGLSASNL